MSGRELPAGWVHVSLDEIGDLYCGQSPSSKDVNREGFGTPYVTGPEQWDGKEVRLDKWTTDPKRIVSKGCVFVTVKGSGVGTLFPGVPAAIGRDIYGFKPNDELYRPYVFNALRNNIAMLIRSARGDIPGLSAQDILGHAVSLPPLREQRCIVEKIEALTAHSRRAREALDALPALIDRYRQSILAAAFRGDLTADWRQEHPGFDAEAARIALSGERQCVWAERRQRRYSPPGGLEFDDLARLPAEWFWATADECAWELTVGHVGPMKDRYVGSGIPFLRSQNVRANRFDPTELRFIPEDFHRELGKSVLRPGDVVVVRSGAPGVACVVPDGLGEANCADLVVCRFLPSLMPKLLAYYINSASARRMIFGMQVGVAQQHFNVGAMARLPVPVIPPGEQKVLLAILDRAFQSIAEMEKRLLAQEDRLSTLDQSILAKAFRGELVPQDPNDEPASVLLERIRAERAATGTAPQRGRRAKGG